MPQLTVTAKGQVTLRKDILEHIGVRPGDRIDVEKLPDGRVEVRAVSRTGKISDLFGMLKSDDGPKLTLEEIAQVTRKGWAGEL